MNKSNGKSVYQPLFRDELKLIPGGNAKPIKIRSDYKGKLHLNKIHPYAIG
jgi:hypothetical protein